MTGSADIFEQNYPTITEDDAIEAAKSERIVQSFNSHPINTPTGDIPALAIKFKFSNGSTETILIGHYAALVMRMMFSQLEKNSWTELASLLPGATPH
jgi:hypothetical protein